MNRYGRQKTNLALDKSYIEVYVTCSALTFFIIYVTFTIFNLASRIRGCVARTSFDEFHRYSTKIVKEAVFGVDEKGCSRNALTFTENNMVGVVVAVLVVRFLK